MARGSRALQAALGAVAGGFTGYAADREYRAEQDRLAREEARRAAKEAADAKREAESLARELARDQRSAIAQGWSPVERISDRDMPGATQRQPFATTKIGDQTYAMRDSEETVAHREGVVKEQKSRAESAAEAKRKQDAINAAIAEGQKAGLDPKKLRALYAAAPSVQGVLAARLFPAPERGGKNEPDADEQERLGRSFISAQSKNPALMNALQTAFANDPSAAENPGQTAYRMMKRGVVPKMGAKSYTPPKPAKASGGTGALMTGDPKTDAELSAIFGGGAAQKPPAPRASPAAVATQGAAPPSSMVDRELTEQRSLWDQAVQIHGRERVLKEFGPRP